MRCCGCELCCGVMCVWFVRVKSVTCQCEYELQQCGGVCVCLCVVGGAWCCLCVGGVYLVVMCVVFKCFDLFGLCGGAWNRTNPLSPEKNKNLTWTIAKKATEFSPSQIWSGLKMPSVARSRLALSGRHEVLANCHSIDGVRNGEDRNNPCFIDEAGSDEARSVHRGSDLEWSQGSSVCDIPPSWCLKATPRAEKIHQDATAWVRLKALLQKQRRGTTPVCISFLCKGVIR